MSNIELAPADKWDANDVFGCEVGTEHNDLLSEDFQISIFG